VGVHRRPIHGLIACAALRGGVSAAVAGARDVSDEDLIRAQCVPVRASRRQARDPLAVRGLHQLAQHDCRSIPPKPGEARPGHLSDIGQRPSGAYLAG